MAANRKLQTEIQQVLKKVEEGCEVFDDIWGKVYAAESQTLKEKFEAELKKEIKKLQRFRDQIKTWIGSNEVKDKNPLVEARKTIEGKMEQFKICEKDTKTKAYSKEGLARETKLDPKEAAREEKRAWLNDCVEKLQDLINTIELEKEKAQLNVKGKNKNKDVLEKCDNRIAKNRGHISRLEAILRLLDQEEIDPNALDSLKDSIDYYLDNASDDDGQFDPESEFDIYEELDLEGFGVHFDAKGLKAEGAKGDKDEEEKQEEAGKVSVVNVVNATGKINLAAVPPAAAKGAKEKEKEKEKEVVKPAPAPKAVPPSAGSGKTIKEVLGGAAPSAPASAPPSAIKTLPQSKEPPAAAPAAAAAPSPVVLIPAPAREESKSESLPSVDTPQDSRPAPTASGKTFASPAPSASVPAQPPSLPTPTSVPSPALSSAPSLPPQGRYNDSDDMNSLAQSINTLHLANQHHLLDSNNPNANSLNSNAISNPTPSLLSPPATLSPELLNITSQLRSSMLYMDSEGEKVNSYQPKNRYAYTHSSFPTTPLFSTPHEVSSLFDKLHLDTQFFSFYFQQQTYQQYLASRKLKKGSWRFHKKYATWFQRHSEPKVATDDYEEGTYVYFDYESGWCQRLKSEFKFEYAYLEDEVAI